MIFEVEILKFLDDAVVVKMPKKMSKLMEDGKKRKITITHYYA